MPLPSPNRVHTHACMYTHMHACAITPYTYAVRRNLRTKISHRRKTLKKKNTAALAHMLARKGRISFIICIMYKIIYIMLYVLSYVWTNSQHDIRCKMKEHSMRAAGISIIYKLYTYMLFCSIFSHINTQQIIYNFVYIYVCFFLVYFHIETLSITSDMDEHI